MSNTANWLMLKYEIVKRHYGISYHWVCVPLAIFLYVLMNMQHFLIYGW